MTPLSFDRQIAPDWARALKPVARDIDRIGEFLSAETAAGRPYLPADDLILRAFQFPLADVRVLIVGQDPYPTPGHPIGLSFAVDKTVRPFPPSLRNIYRELEDDLGITAAPHGDLTEWAANGVMLLNRVLTVQSGAAGSHRAAGWQSVTDAAITALVARQRPLVAILWGRDAAGVKSLLGRTATISSAHPSPLSARRGFFGSRPFSRANDLLASQGAPSIDWRLTS